MNNPRYQTIMKRNFSSGSLDDSHKWSKATKKRISDLEELFKSKGSVHEVLRGLRTLNEIQAMTWKNFYEKYGWGKTMNHFADLSDGIVFEANYDTHQELGLDYLITRNDEEVVHTITIPHPAHIKPSLI